VVVAPYALTEDKRILGTDGDDESCTCAKSFEKRENHVVLCPFTGWFR